MAHPNLIHTLLPTQRDNIERMRQQYEADVLQQTTQLTENMNRAADRVHETADRATEAAQATKRTHDEYVKLDREYKERDIFAEAGATV